MAGFGDEGDAIATSLLRPDRTVRVLIVDDDQAVRSFVARSLRKAGYGTAVASDAAVALGLWDSSGPFDVLITDLLMPGMLGHELARMIRARAPGVKIIYLTGFTLESYATRPILAPDEAYIEKPINLTTLRETMSQLLSVTPLRGGSAG